MNFNNINEIERENPIVYKYLSPTNGLKVLLKKSLKFSRPYEFNDPFDCYEELIKFKLNHNFINEHKEVGILVLDDFEKSLTEEQLLKHLKKVYTFKNPVVKEIFNNSLKQLWISCFSKSYKEILMWSHYGHYHKGICIGFNYLGLSKTFDFIPSDVKYQKRFRKVDYCLDANNAIAHMINTKSSDWKYEQEVRLRTMEDMAPGMSANGILTIDAESVSEIIIGCNCAIRLDTLRTRIEKLGFKNIKIIKLVMSGNSFGFNEIAI